VGVASVSWFMLRCFFFKNMGKSFVLIYLLFNKVRKGFMVWFFRLVYLSLVLSVWLASSVPLVHRYVYTSFVCFSPARWPGPSQKPLHDCK
jgi:hypothetical protein